MAETKRAAADRQLRQRAAQNRILEAEKLRNKFKCSEYIRQIADDMKELGVLSNSIKKVKNTKTSPDKVGETIAKSKARADIIKIKMDTNFKRLNKIIPDVKAFEHSDQNGDNPFEGLIGLMKQATIDNTK